MQQKPLIKNSHQSKRKTRQGYFPVEAATFGPLPPNSSEALYGAQLIGQKCLKILHSQTSILYTPLGLIKSYIVVMLNFSQIEVYIEVRSDFNLFEFSYHL